MHGPMISIVHNLIFDKILLIWKVEVLLSALLAQWIEKRMNYYPYVPCLASLLRRLCYRIYISRFFMANRHVLLLGIMTVFTYLVIFIALYYFIRTCLKQVEFNIWDIFIFILHSFFMLHNISLVSIWYSYCPISVQGVSKRKHLWKKYPVAIMNAECERRLNHSASV